MERERESERENERTRERERKRERKREKNKYLFILARNTYAMYYIRSEQTKHKREKHKIGEREEAINIM